MCLGSPYIFATKPVEEKEKIMEQVYRIGIDHGYGNILCKGKYNPDTF